MVDNTKIGRRGHSSLRIHGDTISLIKNVMKDTIFYISNGRTSAGKTFPGKR